MKALRMIWGLIKVVGPEGLARRAYAGKLDQVDGRVIDAKAKAVSDLVAQIRDPNQMPTLDDSRKQLDALAAKFDQPCPEGVVVREITLPGLTGPRAARVYVPEGGDPMARSGRFFTCMAAAGFRDRWTVTIRSAGSWRRNPGCG
jgi:acetyl esterase